MIHHRLLAARRGFGLELVLPLRFSATAARMRSFNAAALIFSSSWMSMARLTLPSRLELNRPEGSFQRSALGKCQLDDALVRLSRADDAAVGEDRRRRATSLLRRFRGLRRVNDLAHFRERLPAPVSKFVDLLRRSMQKLIFQCRLFSCEVPHNSRTYFSLRAAPEECGRRRVFDASEPRVSRSRSGTSRTRPPSTSASTP